MKHKVNKEALKKFIEELFETKFSKEKIHEKFHTSEIHELLLSMKKDDDNEEEVCIEPFAFIDADGDYMSLMQQELEDEMELNEFMDFYELHPEACPSLDELTDSIMEKLIENGALEKNDVESDLLTIPLEEVELEADELEVIQKIADQIEPIEPGICIPCYVNGEDKYLIDGLNCNIKNVSILGLSLLTPVNLEILKVYIDSDMESEKDIEVSLALKYDDKMVVYKFCMGVLLEAGIISVVDTVELELTPLEFRGIMKKVNVDELNDLLK
jgi:hypothetical protein